MAFNYPENERNTVSCDLEKDFFFLKILMAYIRHPLQFTFNITV